MGEAGTGETSSVKSKAVRKETNTDGVRINTNKMGLLGAISYLIGNVVGSGIFIAPTTVLKATDNVGLSLVVWAIAALISICGALCYVELGTSIRSSGADFAYLCYVRWYPLAFGFMCVGCVVLFPVAIAVQAETFSEYLIQGFNISICNPSDAYWAKKLLGFALIWLLLFINFFSLKTFVSRFQIVATIAKVAATIIVICTGFYYLIFKGKTENISRPFLDASTSVGVMVSATLSGLFAYDGWDILNYGAEEIENPRRTMPLAIIIGLVGVAVIYLATNVSYFIILTKAEVLSSSAVASTFAQHSLGAFQYAIPFLVSILLVGSLNGSIFSASRYLHAAARQGQLPPFISCANFKCDSPRAALFLSVVLSMLMSFAGNLDELIQYASFAQWAQRACTMCALVWIRISHKKVHKDAIRLPIPVPILFAIACIGLIVVETIQNQKVAGVGFAALVGGLVLYALFLWDRTLPSIQSYQRIAQKCNFAVTTVTQIVLNVQPERGSGESVEDMIGDGEDEGAVEGEDGKSCQDPNGANAVPDSSVVGKIKAFFSKSSSKVVDSNSTSSHAK